MLYFLLVHSSSLRWRKERTLAHKNQAQLVTKLPISWASKMDRARKLGPNPTQPSPSREMTLPFLFFSFPFTLFHIPRSVLFFFLEKKFLSLASRCSLRRCPVSTVICLARGSGVPRWSRAKLFSVLPLTFPRNYVPSSRRFLSSSSSRLSLSCKTKKKKKNLPQLTTKPPQTSSAESIPHHPSHRNPIHEQPWREEEEEGSERATR